MKHQFVKDLKAGQLVQDVFYLVSREIRDKKDGGFFLILQLSDKTGTIEGKIWDDAKTWLDLATPGQFFQISGLAREYSGSLEIAIKEISKVPIETVSKSDFLPTSQFNLDDLLSELKSYFSQIKDPYLLRLVENFFADDEFVEQFKTAPGAASVHHTYLGGLLEHTVYMLRLAKEIGKVYPEIDCSLLLTGIILHDVGKIKEYSYEKVIDHTFDGRLLGHIVMGYEMVSAKIAEIPNFPQELRRMLLHMILTHHGHLEFGSPKTPKFVEAFLLHILDYTDARVMMFREAQAKNKGVKWTEYHKFLETNIYIRD
ncbi:MAG: HD domain-containing protein [candidate division WOR-3 bacterium]